MNFLIKMLQVIYHAKLKLFLLILAPYALGAELDCDQKGYRNTFPLQATVWVKFHADALGKDSDNKVVPLGNKEVYISKITGNILTFDLALDPNKPLEIKTYTASASCVNCVESEGPGQMTNDDFCIVPL